MHSEPSVLASSAALTQFLRGIGKRGYVLAEAQSGQIANAQAAVRATLGEFSDAALQLPLAQWPEQFWQRLLAQPALRARPLLHNEVDPLTYLSAGPRAALLLRLVAGLDNVHGAAVLRVSPQAYQQALQRALHVLHGNGIDEVALRALRGRLQLRVKELPERFLDMPAGPASPQRASRGSATTTSRQAHRAPRRWLRPALWTGLCLLVLAFAGTFIPDHSNQASTLPEQPVAARLSPAAVALASPDFALLNDPDGERAARDLPLLSWYDAGSIAPNPAGSETSPTTLPETATPESSSADTEQNEDGQPDAP